MEKKRPVVLKPIDLDIFYFLWRWKLSTTLAIGARFFPGHNPVIAYNRLNSLKRAGFLHLRTLDESGNGYVWTLTRKSFRLLGNRFPVLKEEGFRSESLEHDFYATAAHLGEWVGAEPPDVELFTEQELRRYNSDHYPAWLPRTTLRRPDGYWLVPYKGTKITVALEVELTAKDIGSYDAIAQFYRNYPKVIRIVWVIKTLAMAKYIDDKIKKSVPEETAKRHLFALLPDFVKLGWHAPLLFGFEQGRTLGYVLGPHRKRENHQVGITWAPTQNPLLDTRKYPGDARTWTAPAKNAFIDCMASRPSIHPLQSNHIQAPTSISLTSPSLTPSSITSSQSPTTNSVTE